MSDPLVPARTALLLMDYQNGIVDRYADAGRALLDRVAAAIGTARAAGTTIGYVRVGLDEAEAAAVPSANKTFSALAGGGSMGADDPATAVVAAVRPHEGDLVVRKKRVGAFSTTDLDARSCAAGGSTRSCSVASRPAGWCCRRCGTPRTATTDWSCSRTCAPTGTRRCTRS